MSMPEFLFYFSVYSCFGWILENSYSYIKQKKFLKDNFFLGPFKPMYGISPLLLILLTEFRMPLFFFLICCFLVPTIVEYVSGVMLYRFFNRKYWDYSHMRYQFQGHVSLIFSLCWLALSVFCITWIHPGIAGLYKSFEGIWKNLYVFVFIYFCGELLWAIKRYVLNRPMAEVRNKETDPM